MTQRAGTPLDQDSARTALDELFTLAHKYNSSDAYLELMRFVGRFRFYSPFNAMLIYTQMPGAHFVCTALRWRRDYHREIKIGARPIVILQPMGPILFVFDVSDTAPLPNARPLPIRVEDPFQGRSGKIGGQLALTIENAKRDGAQVSERADGSQCAGSIQRAAAGQHLEFTIAQKQPIQKSTQIPLWFELLLNSIFLPKADTERSCTSLRICIVATWARRMVDGGQIAKIFHVPFASLRRNRSAIWFASDEYLAGYVRKCPVTPSISLDRVMKSVGLLEQMGRARLGLRKANSQS
jgi:hypothetical protein